MKRFLRVIPFCIICTLLISSCGFQLTQITQQADENAINTSVAQTVAAAGSSATSPQPTEPFTPTATSNPTITPQPLATVETLPTLTPTEDQCNRAKFEDDITIEDGSVLAPNTEFTKTWRFSNTGTCTWNTNYALVFSSGSNMSAPAVTYLTGNVPPGSTVDLSVKLKSPATDGTYKDNFMLRSDAGILFGTGPSRMAPVYVSIEVVTQQVMPGFDFGGFLPLFPLETLVYDFGANACIANWRNASDPGFLACPGNKTDAQGFVTTVDSPKLQDGNKVNGIGLFTHPQWVDGGSISGTYPLLTVENGMKFKAVLGCGFGGAACNVRFLLRYRIEGGALQELTNWEIKYADAPVTVNYDLAPLAGKKVNFVLQVVTNGSSAQDWAHWVNPRIVK